MESALQVFQQIHLEPSRILDDFGVQKHLVGLSEAKSELILMHQLAILLRPFAAHVVQLKLWIFTVLIVE